MQVGIDEFTVILLINIKKKTDWNQKAKDIIDEFCYRTNLTEIFGHLEVMEAGKPAGYSHAFTFANQPFYLAIAYHESHPRMGILVKFSAYAWAEYQARYYKEFNYPMTILLFFKLIHSENYDFRLSRIDLTCDFQNYDKTFSPNYIYQHIKSKSYLIADDKGRKTNRKISVVENEGKTDTLYIGSRGENSRLLVRIYNKKKELINKKGFRLSEALECDSWTRFESSYRGVYAHQLTDNLKALAFTFDFDELEDTEQAEAISMALGRFLLDKILEKTQFVINNGEKDKNKMTFAPITQEMIAHLSDIDYGVNLRLEQPTNNSIYSSVNHIINGSGLYPTMAKIRMIWGTNGEEKFYQYLYKIYEQEFLPIHQNDGKLKRWFKQNFDTLADQTLESVFPHEYKDIIE